MEPENQKQCGCKIRICEEVVEMVCRKSEGYDGPHETAADVSVGDENQRPYKIQWYSELEAVWPT